MAGAKRPQAEKRFVRGTPRNRSVVVRPAVERGESRRGTPRRENKRNTPKIPLIPLAIAAAVLLLALILITRSCGASQTELPQEMATSATSRERAEFLYRNVYDWDNLKAGGNGRYQYVVDGEVLSRTGIDVSEHQGEIDWQKVAADGIEFAFIRAGYRTTDTGVVVKDEMYDVNIRRAKGAGIEVGVYFYSQARDKAEALEEAEAILRTLNGERLDYPVVFDLEPAENNSDRLAGLTHEQFTEIAKTFCDRVTAGGYDAMIYGSRNDLSNYNLSDLADFGLWYAEYDTAPRMELRFAIWQYMQSGSVDGIKGNVDMDVDLSAALAAIESPEEKSDADADEDADADAGSGSDAGSSS